MVEERCPDCKGKVIIVKDEKYCKECGLVLEDEA